MNLIRKHKITWTNNTNVTLPETNSSENTPLKLSQESSWWWLFLGWGGVDPSYTITWILSGDSWMYPYQRTPMGNPYISTVARGYLWVSYPQESQGWTPAKYHGSTRTLGVHPSLSLDSMESRNFGPMVPWSQSLMNLEVSTPSHRLLLRQRGQIVQQVAGGFLRCAA